MVVSIVMGAPLKWLLYKGKSIYKWMMTGGYSHFKKPPSGVIISGVIMLLILAPKSLQPGMYRYV